MSRWSEKRSDSSSNFDRCSYEKKERGSGEAENTGTPLHIIQNPTRERSWGVLQCLALPHVSQAVVDRKVLRVWSSSRLQEDVLKRDHR
jgi:hypothetical protein